MKLKRTIIRFFAALGCIALLFTALPIQSAHAESTLATGFVNTTKLNMRTGTSTKDSIVATLEKNTAVNIYEVKGTWLRIDVPSTGKSGYVSGKYITVNSSSLSAYALGVTSGRVNLRKEATSKSESLAVVEGNSGVTVYSADKTTGWYKVKVHATGKEGYMSPSYVKIVAKVDKSGSTNKLGEITASNVNLRSGPGTSYSRVAVLQKLDEVTMLEKSGTWYKVTVKATNKTGYVSASYVKEKTAGNATPTPTPAGSQSGKMNTGNVNFRNGPGTTYTVLGMLAKDTAVTVLLKSGDWYKITVSFLRQNRICLCQVCHHHRGNADTDADADANARLRRRHLRQRRRRHRRRRRPRPHDDDNRINNKAKSTMERPKQNGALFLP